MESPVDQSALSGMLADLHRSLVPAHAVLVEVRRRVEACWPRRPSLRVLDAESYDLCKAVIARVGVPETGELSTVIDAGANTLRALNYDLPDLFDVANWQWQRESVDREAASQPQLESRLALRDALTDIDEWLSVLKRRIDDVDRVAPPESWLPEWTIEEARAYIARVTWQFARTMPKSPHYYTVRWKRPELARDFLALAQLIQSAGELKTWKGSVRAYLEVDGWEYWTMGARVPETYIINRAHADGAGAAQPLPPVVDSELLKGVERALAYRRLTHVEQTASAGVLGTRLLALLPPRT